MTMESVQGQRVNGCGCGKRERALTRGLALTDPPPLLAQAVDSSWQALTRLQGTVANADNAANRSREQARRETGVNVDANPYHGLTRDKIEAVVRAAFHARAMPEVLLAKWAKEGSTAMTVLAQPVSQATTAANAKTLLRSSIYYRQLGVDWLTVTRRPDPHGDNLLDETDAGAPAQERNFANRVAELVRNHFLSEDITRAVNAELTATLTGGTFSVQPSVRFYGLSLQLVDAVFSRFLAMSFPELSTVTEELGYLLWNMGEVAFRTFLRSADAHRREPAFLVDGQPISIERWALHTQPRANEYAQPRANAIRFAHYIRSYRPIFENAINLIKPGIEDLRRAGAHAAGLDEDPLGLAPSARPAEGGTGSRTLDTQAAAGGRGAFRHAPLAGDPGDNVELRWNVPAGTSPDTAIDIVVHLHGYGADGPHFLADKARLAGADLVDSAGVVRVRANRATLVVIPRGRHDQGAAWLWDRLPDARAFNALVTASLAWLASNALHLPGGGTLREGRCTLVAHSGGGAGLSALLAAGVDPDEVVCFDSMYGGEAPIRAWALARLRGSRAASSALRVFYTGSSAPSSAHPGGVWVWSAGGRRWTLQGTGSWSWRGTSAGWRLVTTEVSSRRLKEALDAALASDARSATLRARFRVQRTSTPHDDIPTRYTAALLDDAGANVPDASEPPASTVRPACCANSDWLTSAPVKPGGNDPPPPRPASPPAEARSQANGDASGRSARSNGAAANTLAGGAPRVIPVDGFAPVAVSRMETAFTAPSKVWREVCTFSRVAFDAQALGDSYAEWRNLGFARDSGADGFEVRIKGRLVVPGDLGRRPAKVPLVVICMGNHNTFDARGEIASFEGYDYLQQSLAAAGYASLSVDTNPANELDAGIRMRAELLLATVEELRTHGESGVVSRIDFGNVGLVGHSRGGEAVVYAAKTNRTSASPLGIKAVVSVAPTDLSRGCSSAERWLFSPATTPGGTPVRTGPLPLGSFAPLTLTPADGVRYFVLYGSHDGDVTGDGDEITAPVGGTSERAGTGFSLYDRATCEKTMIFPRGLTHNRFNTKWDNCKDYADPEHSFVIADCQLRNPAERFNAFIFAAAKHRELAQFYVGAVMDRVLKGDASKEDVLRGKHALPPHTIAFQFLPADRLDVSLAGASPLVRTFGIVHCPHDTTVFQGVPGARARASVGSVDLRAQRRSALTMRVGAQYAVPSVATIAGERTPTFTVKIESRAGTSLASDRNLERAGSLEPDKPFFHEVTSFHNNVTKLQLDTVVLPLSAFQPPVDLGDVRAVEIEIGPSGTSPVFIDSLAFV